jgi:hypothetical protein
MTNAVNVATLGGNPTFRAYLTGNQSVSGATWTKVAMDAESFDTANAYDSTTNYRFTPQVAGYYQLNGQAYCSSGAITNAYVALYKNGSASSYGNLINLPSGVNYLRVTVSDIIYLNGSTDYIELWGWMSGGSTFVFGYGSSSDSYLSGTLIRAA